MTSTFAVLLVIGIFAFAFLKDKLISMMFSGINRKLLYRSEYEEGERITSEVITYNTSASRSEIMDALKKYVKISEGKWNITFKTYQFNLTENSISYAFGNIVNPQSFLVTLLFPKENSSEWSFRVLKWTEVNGIHTSIKEIKELLNQIEKSLLTLWATIEKTENPETNNSVNNDTWIDSSEIKEEATDIATEAKQEYHIPNNWIQPENVKRILQVIGWILFLLALIKAKYIGYYQREALWLFGAWIIWLILLYVWSNLKFTNNSSEESISTPESQENSINSSVIKEEATDITLEDKELLDQIEKNSFKL